MKVTLESTQVFVMHNGAKCRVWDGTTEAGHRCFALIPAIAHREGDDAPEFNAELQELTEPDIRPLNSLWHF